MLHANEPPALPARQAGVCLHLTSLPGEYGIGGIGDGAAQFIEWLASVKIAVWQFLPAGPTAYRDSPYQGLSAFAGNEMLIDVGDLVSLKLLSPKSVKPLRRLPKRSVDYGRLTPLKHALLLAAAAAFETGASAALKVEFDDFMAQNDKAWLHDYALYRVLKGMHGGKAWPKWDRAFVSRQPAAMKKLENDADADIRSWKVCQFLFARQWKTLRKLASEKDVRLFGDVPMYIALDSADAWANPDILLLSRSGQPAYVAGVPPDYFSRGGQLWGNPVYDWERQAADGFRWWIARLQHALSQFDLVRIDHFRGLQSYWAVPAAARTARNGRWRAGPREAFFDALHRAIPEAPIIAEDLGMLTPEVEALRKRYHLPGMKVLQFDVTRKDFTADDIPELCVCYSGTHDNDTTRGWFEGGCGVRRGKRMIRDTRKSILRITGGSAKTIAIDLVRLAFRSRARLAVAPMQDLLNLGTKARLNTPGKSGNNWRWRLSAAQLTARVRDTVLELVETSDRTPGA